MWVGAPPRRRCRVPARPSTQPRARLGIAHLRSLGGDRHASEPPEPSDQALLDALRSLPPKQRAVVALHYLDDASVRTIAETMGIVEGTVKAHLSHGRAALAAALDRPRRFRTIRPTLPRSDS